MLDLINNMMMGFDVALSPSALLACFIGVTLGTFLGILPGIGPLAGISLLLPLTFTQTPVDAIVMLAGIYYGAMYGSSTAAILLHIPGTVAAAVVCIDGYPMARQGRAGVALAITTFASFIGGCFAIILMMVFALPLTTIASSFGSVEYFSMTVLALVAASTMSPGSPIKGVAMVVVGLLLGMVGTDVNSGYARYTFGVAELLDGVNLVVLAMGMFGVAEVFHLRGGILKYLEEVPEQESLWRGECFVFDERVSVTHGLERGEARLCRACRRPLTPEERASPLHVEGISCVHCHGERADDDRARYAERQRQVELAERRGAGPHVGRQP